MHFIKWLSDVRNFEIKDHLNLGSEACEGHFEEYFYDRYTKDFETFKIYPSNPKHLKRITTIKDNGQTIKVYPVSKTHQSEIDSWCDDSVYRINVCQRAIDQLMLEEKSEAEDRFFRVKNMRRLEALKKTIDHAKPMKSNPDSKVRYYLVFEWAKNSILIFFNEILPLLISGIPIMVVTNIQNSLQLSYLRALLISSGAPESIFHHWIVKNDLGNKSGVYLLTETADAYSSLENIMNTCVMSNLTSIVVFAQESLKLKITKYIEQKFPNFVDSRFLFDDKEFINTFSVASFDLDSLSFVELKPGIHFHYYRHLPESIKMIDYLIGLNEQREYPPIPISIWSAETGMAIKLARQIRNSPNMSINCSPAESKLNSDHQLPQWPFELLVGHQSYEKFIKDTNLNLKKPNTSWPSLNNRAQLLIEMLNKCNNEKQMAKFPNEQFIRMIFECHSSGGDRQHRFKENLNDRNLLQLDYKSPPLGNFIVLLGDDNDEDVLSCDDASHSSLLSIFFLTLLLHGNFLTLIGTKDALKHWKPMVKHLNSNPNGQNVMQMIVARNDNNVDEDDQNVDGFFMVSNKRTDQVDDDDDDDQEDACLLLLNQEGHIQSVFIDQSHYIKHKAMDDYWMLQQNLLKWLQNGRLSCSILIALQEFDMKHMVE